MNERPAGARHNDDLEGSRMTFGEHLTELRARLLKAVIATLIAVLGATAFAEDLVRLVLAPIRTVLQEINANPALVATGPTQSFVTYFKVSLIAGLIAAGPVWIYQVWAFISAGLYRHERRWVGRFAPLSLALFCGGVTFGYAVLLPVALKWLLTFASPDLIQNWITVSEYLSLFTLMTLLLGIAFQLPVVMVGLSKAGMISAAAFRGRRKITILLIFIVAGILTPPDPVTQPLVAVPLCLLYELGILMAWFAEGARRAPVDWSGLRRKGLVVAGIALLALVFRGRIAAVFGGVAANQRVETGAAGGLAWTDVASRVLGAAPEGAMRINDDPASPLLAAVGGGRVAVLRFRRSADPAVVVEAQSRAFRTIHVPTGATVWDVDLPSGLTLRDVLSPAVAAIAVGNDETRRVARAILRAAIPEGLPDDDEEAAAAASAWLEARSGAVFVQPP